MCEDSWGAYEGPQETCIEPKMLKNPGETSRRGQERPGAARQSESLKTDQKNLQ